MAPYADRDTIPSLGVCVMASLKSSSGFSLVELVIVVAIMAVLIAILAPAYLSYVEKTRIGADENTAEEIRGATYQVEFTEDVNTTLVITGIWEIPE